MPNGELKLLAFELFLWTQWYSFTLNKNFLQDRNALGPLALSLRKLLWSLYLLFPCPLPNFHYLDPTSLPFLPPTFLQSWCRPATPKTAAKQLQLSVFFQLIYRIKSSLPLQAGSQCVESTMLVLCCCGWALTHLCPHPDLWEIVKVRRLWESWESRIRNRKSRGIRVSCSCKAWKQKSSNSGGPAFVPISTADLERCVKFSDFWHFIPALTDPWIRDWQSQGYKGGPSRVWEKRGGRSPLVQSPCHKKKLYCLLGEW